MSQSILNNNIVQSIAWSAIENAQKKVDNALACFEEGLNIAGYVPLLRICKVAGMLRIEYGKAQICASVALAVLVTIASLFSKNSETRYAGLKFATTLLTTYSGHGLANIVRGYLEIVPYLSLVTCLPYDMTNNRCKYPTEVPGRWVYVQN